MFISIQGSAIEAIARKCSLRFKQKRRDVRLWWNGKRNTLCQMDKVAVGIKNNINVLLNFGGFINHDECAHGQAITLAANNQGSWSVSAFIMRRYLIVT
ncbi:hypothetical protein UP00_12045 [Enterobacter asburiae]|nr:hypothetical protein UP00_12045 [Enterobacter asburiae]